MNCHYHPNVPAAGVCKSCMRGLCSSCAVEVSQGLACSGRCEDDVRALAALIQHNLHMVKAAPGYLRRQRISMMIIGGFIALMGAFFAWVGFVADDHIVWPLAVLGVLIAPYGFFMIVRAARERFPS